MKHISKFSNFSLIKEELVSPDYRNELIKLVGDGDVNALDKFMDENNVDVNFDSGMMLRLAAKLGKLELVKYFNEIGGDFSLRRNLALKTALAYGQLEVAKYLLEDQKLSPEQLEDVKEYIVSSETMSPAEKNSAMKLLGSDEFTRPPVRRRGRPRKD